MSKNIIIFGTRPEFIKLIPIFFEIKKQNLEDKFEYIFTTQHHDLINDLFELFDFKPNYTIISKDFNNSITFSFTHILSEIQKIIDKILTEKKINFIIAQGDTTSSICASICAFFNNIPFAHIEAGLRTNDMNNPFPEEFFRKTISLASTIHFAPTLLAQSNLIKEGINPDKILLTGNTIVDAIEIIKKNIFNKKIDSGVINMFSKSNNILITCHRRENQNSNFMDLVEAIKILATENPLINFLWISHSNPFVQKELENVKFNNANIHIIKPLNIFEQYSLYGKTKIIITDSGGIQEESPSFQIPVIIIRNETERIESVNLGYSFLVKNIKNDLIRTFNKIKLRTFCKMKNPYGDGKSAEKIIAFLNNNSINGHQHNIPK